MRQFCTLVNVARLVHVTKSAPLTPIGARVVA
jgi:hypothetical protein